MHTDGLRIYAIGDIHGMIDALREVHDWIARDMAQHPGRDTRIIHLGDYTDRGPDSRGVIDFLIAGDGPTWINLMGNHDRMFARYATHPGWQDPKLYREKGYHYLHPRIGGGETLAGYGVEIPAGVMPLDQGADFHEAAALAIPRAHIDFIEGLTLQHRIGDYLFVHAGIDPMQPPEDQTLEDLIWIREGWMEWQGTLPFTVVHGHTVVEQPEHHGHRIAVDTGAVFGNQLSCLVLDGDEVGILTAHNVRPLLPRS